MDLSLGLHLLNCGLLAALAWRVWNNDRGRLRAYLVFVFFETFRSIFTWLLAWTVSTASLAYFYAFFVLAAGAHLIQTGLLLEILAKISGTRFRVPPAMILLAVTFGLIAFWQLNPQGFWYPLLLLVASIQLGAWVFVAGRYVIGPVESTPAASYATSLIPGLFILFWASTLALHQYVDQNLAFPMLRLALPGGFALAMIAFHIAESRRSIGVPRAERVEGAHP